MINQFIVFRLHPSNNHSGSKTIFDRWSSYSSAGWEFNKAKLNIVLYVLFSSLCIALQGSYHESNESAAGHMNNNLTKIFVNPKLEMHLVYTLFRLGLVSTTPAARQVEGNSTCREDLWVDLYFKLVPKMVKFPKTNKVWPVCALNATIHGRHALRWSDDSAWWASRRSSAWSRCRIRIGCIINTIISGSPSLKFIDSAK